MMQTTLSPNLVAYTSMNNQTPENILKPRIKVTLIRRGILDCRGKPLLQNLEQVTLNNIKSVIYENLYSCWLLSPVKNPDSTFFDSQFSCSISTWKG